MDGLSFKPVEVFCKGFRGKYIGEQLKEFSEFWIALRTVGLQLGLGGRSPKARSKRFQSTEKEKGQYLSDVQRNHLVSAFNCVHY
jgi:hypothetical protein